MDEAKLPKEWAGLHESVVVELPDGFPEHSPLIQAAHVHHRIGNEMDGPWKNVPSRAERARREQEAKRAEARR